nr:MerR family DNA-binding protein [Geodermatophilaceae bacterium]
MVEDGELFGVAEVRRRTGLSRKALRLYEEAGLVAPATRTQAGYRLYDAGGLQRLELIRRARALGLHLRQLPEFLDIAQGCCDKSQPELAAILADKLGETQQRMEDLRQLHDTLQGQLGRLQVTGGHGHRCEELLCTCSRSGAGPAEP